MAPKEALEPAVAQTPEMERPGKGAADAVNRDAQLVASEIQLRSYMEAALRAIMAVSVDGKIVFINGHTEQIFGYTRAELMGHDSRMLLPERFHAAYATAIRAYFAAPSVRILGKDIDLAGRRKNSDEFPIEICLSYIQAHEGIIAIGFVSDITDRRRIRDELAGANAELRRSNADLEQFAHLASHDLREPLRMVTSYLDLLEQQYGGQLDAAAREYIGFAAGGAARMRTLIDDLLKFSRAGAQELCIRSVAAETILAGALDNLKVALDQSAAAVTFDPLPEIVADPGLMTLVFQNLIGNAIKFRNNGPPKVHVSAKARDGEWIFSVRDNGIGIALRDAAQVFQIFERLHPTDKYPGTGVGLAIAQRVVERHGGKIWLESEVGIGTTFLFSVPNRGASTEQN